MADVDPRLLQDDALERSCVVANRQMNRERTLTGSNGYAKEIEFNPLTLLLENAKQTRWLDLCCGSGKALFEAAQAVHNQGMEGKIQIIGVDLVGMHFPHAPQLTCLHLIEASLTTWQPTGQFDLITCVHGLHYIGDKLGLVSRAASWLRDDGQFVANLDLNNVKLADGRSASRLLAKELRKQGMDYNSRKKIVSCAHRALLHLPFGYLGANDQAGPNYTRQPAVDSYYERLTRIGQERVTAQGSKEA
jgi:SAM-dependent methyltransferase